MTEILKQTIQEEILKLPKELQGAINMSGWMIVSEQIGKENLLTDEQINAFQAETSLVLLGIEDNYSYASNIKNNVGVETEKAEKIAKETFEKILKPITDILEENVKKNLGNKRVTLTQNVDFILSGGDYSSFVDKPDRKDEVETTDKILGTSNILEVKDRLIN